MMGIDNIKKSALAFGACEKVNDVRTIKDGIQLLQTPQGREFAMKTGYPSLETWRENADSIDMLDVFLDCGEAEVKDCDFIAVGDCRIKASFSAPDQLYHVIAMHGAEVLIEAKNYAVLIATNIESKMDISNDGTAIVNVEQSRIRR